MFKKLLMVLLAGMVCTMSACSTNDEAGTEPETESETTTTNDNIDIRNSLVVYFSYSGNTEKIANWVAAESASDLFEIIPTAPYPTDYDECVDLASEEKEANARPEIEGKVENMDTYDTIYLGYPCWWGTTPMIVLTFLESYDLQDKTIIPFTTHGGSGFGTSITDIRVASNGATVVENGLEIRDSNIDDSESAVTEWVQSFK